MSTEKETVAFVLQTLEVQQRDIYNVRSRKPNISNCYDVGFTRPNIKSSRSELELGNVFRL